MPHALRPAYRCVLSLAVLLLVLVPSLAEAALPGSQRKPFQKAPSLKERVKNDPKAGTGKAGGKFRLSYAQVQDPDYRELRNAFKEEKFLEEVVSGLNETFRIPRDVEVTMRECGEANAYYESDSRRISLCYELVGYFADFFYADAETEEDEDAAAEAVAGATLFTLFHELGHALIDVWDLPITGREEDAVDQLATIILLEGGEDGEAAALNGALSFWEEEDQEASAEEEEASFWDEHSLGEQRYYNIVCWSYGSNPEGLADLIEDEWLPQERADQCPDEFARMSKAWDTLLSPYVR